MIVTYETIAAKIMSLKTAIDTRFNVVDRRFDAVDERLEELSAALRPPTAAAVEQGTIPLDGDPREAAAARE